MSRAASMIVALALLAGGCSKNSQAPDGEPLVRRAEPGAAVAVGKPEQGPGATHAMPMPVGPMVAVPARRRATRAGRRRRSATRGSRCPSHARRCRCRRPAWPC